jgi:hypothetical protein
MRVPGWCSATGHGVQKQRPRGLCETEQMARDRATPRPCMGTVWSGVEEVGGEEGSSVGDMGWEVTWTTAGFTWASTWVKDSCICEA